MIIKADPRKVQQAVVEGFKRLKKYRKRRAAYIKEYCGESQHETSINLLFATIRAFVPNLVMKSGINNVTTEILEHKMTADMLSFGLDTLHREIHLKSLLRAWIVDAIFAMGIMETGLAVSDNLVGLKDDVWVDEGRIYSQIVDLDDFVIDPECRRLEEAFFMGRLVRCPRAELYEVSGLKKNLIAELPQVAKGQADRDERVEMISKERNSYEMQDIEDFVEVVKLYVPAAHSIIYMPDPRVTTFDDFIGVKEFYGPEEGPYSFLSFSQPVSDNPLPVAPVGIWYDLHRMTNRIFGKAMDQADGQRDFILYQPQTADTVQDMRDATSSLEAIMCENPAGITTHSIGGANPENISMLGQLSTWYNYVAGNPEQIAGLAQSAETATGQEIMQANANVTLNDMRDMVYDGAGGISKKHGWYLWTDPLIKLPRTVRDTGGEDIQLWLTPEQIEGDFYQYYFKIRPRSMQQLDPMIRTKRILEFYTKTVPSLTMAAQMAMQMGTQFNLQRALTQAAEELDIIDAVGEIFDDPEYQEKLAIMLQFGAKNAGKASSAKGVMQNEGSPMAMNVSSPQQESNSMAQETSAISQGARRSNLDMNQWGM